MGRHWSRLEIMSETTPEITILRELLDGELDFLSGSKLAAKLGMSRVGVWAHMEKLRKQGFGFEAVRSRGYRLTQRPNELHPALIEAHLRSSPRKVSIHFLSEVDSTSSEAERLLAAGESAPFVVLSRRQFAGPRRPGRPWHMPANGNLYSSFPFRPLIEPSKMQT